jgi:hypothetical protein
LQALSSRCHREKHPQVHLRSVSRGNS